MMTVSDPIASALEEMLLCPSDDPAAPRVGAVLTTNDEIIATSHRGADGHAEYALLKELPKGSLVGSTLYTTLEPCTFRGVDHALRPKVSCADLILETGLSRVVIGMLDPNPYILGNGVIRLRERAVEVSFFPPKAMLAVEGANHHFRQTYGLADDTDQASSLLGHWIAESTFEGGKHTTEDVFLQCLVGNRIYGVMLNHDLGLKYDFYIIQIDGDVWDYSFRSKVRAEKLDHGAGVLIFDTHTSARAAGVTHGAFAPSSTASILVNVELHRAAE